ncbi:MAG: 3-deoxy-8-phosphooctulonate synthase [Acidobacteriota bacterium]|jgi:2-dehydro-3-deoxyphosphooctonate aldolase (KDO 8-P synthase)
MENKVKVADGVEFGGGALGLIAGPCVIESREHCLRLAREIAAVAGEIGIPWVFKASFDKANRTSIESFRGPGMEEGLAVLAEVRDEIGVPVLTDVHAVSQVEPVAAVADVVQIPAFLCRQTDLLVAAAESGRPVNVKKGQFLAPGDMRHVVGKLTAAGARGVLLTERGTSFGYNNLVVDFKGLCRLQDLGHPVVFDVTHSLQLPGAGEGETAGERRFAEPLALAAAAVRVDVLFIEVHDDPPAALSDGATQLPLERLRGLLENALRVHAVAPVTSADAST